MRLAWFQSKVSITFALVANISPAGKQARGHAAETGLAQQLPCKGREEQPRLWRCGCTSTALSSSTAAKALLEKNQTHTHTQKITLPTGLPPPYRVIAQVVPLAYQRGQPATHTVMAFFFLIQVLYLLLSLHFILDGMYGFVQETALQCCSTFSSSRLCLAQYILICLILIGKKKKLINIPTLSYLALCPKGVNCGLRST